MPIEIELLISAWDNAKKHAFDGDGWNIDPETGEVLADEMPDDLADLVADIDDKMMDLISYYRAEEEVEVSATATAAAAVSAVSAAVGVWPVAGVRRQKQRDKRCDKTTDENAF